MSHVRFEAMGQRNEALVNFVTSLVVFVAFWHVTLVKKPTLTFVYHSFRLAVHIVNFALALNVRQYNILLAFGARTGSFSYMPSV